MAELCSLKASSLSPDGRELLDAPLDMNLISSELMPE
jgi:hypothetical protein